MQRADKISNAYSSGGNLHITVDDRAFVIDLAPASARLAQARGAQRATFEVSPSGYGLHWPELDEDLAIDGLVNLSLGEGNAP